jgi:hypothetical protein
MPSVAARKLAARPLGSFRTHTHTYDHRSAVLLPSSITASCVASAETVAQPSHCLSSSQPCAGLLGQALSSECSERLRSGLTAGGMAARLAGRGALSALLLLGLAACL